LRLSADSNHPDWNSRLWIWFGVLAGLGLMNKHSTAFFCFTVTIGLLLTPQRKEFGKEICNSGVVGEWRKRIIVGATA
jgi:hypothetical protein